MALANKYSKKAIHLGLKNDNWLNIVHFSTILPDFLLVFIKKLLLPLYRAIIRSGKSTNALKGL